MRRSSRGGMCSPGSNPSPAHPILMDAVAEPGKADAGGMDILAAGAARLGLPLSVAQLAQFAEYTRLLADGNRRANLTAITDPDAVQVRHYLDSLTAVLALRDWPDGMRVMDLGAGAGFPGIPLKIVYPNIKLTLADSVGKKTAFLQDLTARLGLDDVAIQTARAEDLGRAADCRSRFDVVLARGVARMPTLIEYALPLCRVGGRLIAWKGQDGPAEAQGSHKALRELKGAVAGVQSADAISPPLPPHRWLIMVMKTAPTPGRYPRRTGVPAKQPL